MAIEMGEGFKELFKSDAVPFLKAGASVATGALSAIGGGIAGTSYLLSGKLGITNDDAQSAATVIEAIQKKGTYIPQDAEAQQYLQVLTSTLQEWGVDSDKVGDFFMEMSEALGGSSDTQAATGAVAKAATDVFVDPFAKIFPAVKGAGTIVAAGVIGDALKTGRSQADVMRAFTMKQNGATPEEIWQKHKMFQGADGKWRSIIDDTDSKLIPDHIEMVGDVVMLRQDRTIQTGMQTVGDILKHDQAYATMPWIKDIGVFIMPLGGGMRGSYNPLTNTITLDRSYGSAAELHSTLLHEIQHAIQEKHGLPGGAAPSMWYPKELADLDTQVVAKATELNKRHDELIASGKMSRNGWVNDGYESDIDIIDYHLLHADVQKMNSIRFKAVDNYRKTIGEVEARLVQQRWASKTPNEGFPVMDTPIDQQIRSPNDLNRWATNRKPAAAIDPVRFTKQFPEFQGSKVVDEQGRLKPFYHGTIDEIRGRFRYATETSGQLGIHFGSRSAANDRTKGKEFMRRQVEPERGEPLPNTHEVYLNIQNPVRMIDDGHWAASTVVKQLEDRADLTLRQRSILQQYKINHPNWRESEGPPDSSVRKLLKDLGYDGVVYTNKYEGFPDEDSWIALDPNQIRSSISGKAE